MASFSGGGETIELHKINGGNIDTDICCEYLRFFLDDDIELNNILIKYKKGELLSVDLKNICFNTIYNVIKNHQINKLKL